MPRFYPMPSISAMAHPSSLEGELLRVAMALNEGDTPEQLLSILYDTLSPFVPCDRLSVALLEGPDTLVLRYLHSKGPELWGLGSRGQLTGSSLEAVVHRRQVRIIEDLEAYAARRPDSFSAAKVISEGLRSNLTLPLISRGKVIGVVFFASIRKAAYQARHVALLSMLSSVLGIAFERAELIAELRRANQDLRSLDQLKTNFLSNLSHELRTPLSVVISYMQTVAEGDLGPLNSDQANYLCTALEAADRLSALLNDLLDFTELETGTLRLSCVEVDLAAIVREVVADLRARLEAGGLTVEHTEGPEPLMVEGDPPRLAQVLHILLDNARKFTPAPGRVRVSVQRRGDQAVLEVKDTGKGIAPENQSRLFEKFFQVESGTTRTTGGVGLGLSLARAIVHAHHGTIGVVSSLGAGSTFWVQIPLITFKQAP